MSDRSELESAIVSAYRTVSKGLDRSVLPVLVERGITMAQLKALMAVTGADDNGLTVTALGTALAIGQPSASLLVEQLVRQGLVTRTTDQADRRRAIVSASPEGEELADELRLGRRATFAEWLGRLSDADAQELARALAALARATGAGADTSA